MSAQPACDAYVARWAFSDRLLVATDTTGYGGHGAGFALATVACNTVEGLCLVTALKCLGAF